jgi:pimeloyl-ACP methyl ester carboxylesterase
MIKTNWIILLLSFSFFLLSSQTDVPYGDNSAAGHYIELNGVKHYYEVYGQGKPMLVIHGNSTATKGMAPQIEYFSKKYKVYSVDCRGRGKSALGPDSLSYLQMAKDLGVFLRKMELDSVDIIGKSDGGVIALLMGIYYPSAIRRIVAFGSNVNHDSTAFFPSTLKEFKENYTHADEMLAKGDTSRNWKLEKYKFRLMAFQPQISAADLHRIKNPVLIISCDRDVIREEHTMYIYKNIPRANLCILPGEKHGVPRLNPPLFNSMVDQYLSRPYRGDELRFEK